MTLNTKSCTNKILAQCIHQSCAANQQHPSKRKNSKIISEEEKAKEFIPKGIYRAIVEEGFPLFVYNELNYYHSVELNAAKHKLGLKVTFIEDGEFNMLEYTNDKCVPLKSLYEKFVKFCYP